MERLAMPMIDVTIPEGALKPEAEERLMKELTDILIRAEGYTPDKNKVAQNVTWAFLHRPAAIYRAGVRSDTVRYRIVPSVPEGQYTDAAREALVKECTEAVVRAAGGKREDVAPFVWVFPTEIPDGQWGGQGHILRLPDIHAMLLAGEPDHIKAGQDAHKVGQERVARRRQEKARELLDAVQKGTAAA
jgi:phenylpyruvate tautomerase PptA (4-oxalocrotonate tautomerase family)